MVSWGARAGRIIASVPFLFVAAWCWRNMDPGTIASFGQPFADSGLIEWEGGKVKIIDHFHGVEFLDQAFRGGMGIFSPSTFGYDDIAWWQIFSFLIDLGPVYAIWIMESYRTGYIFTPVYFPTVFTVAAQFFGIGCIAPYFYFFSFAFGPAASDLAQKSTRDRTVWDKGHGSLLLLIFFLFHTSEVFAMCLSPEFTTRHYWTWAWQMTPLWIGASNILLTGLASWLLPKSSFLKSPKVLLSVLGMVSASVWCYTLLFSPYSLSTIFIPTSEMPLEFVLYCRRLFQVDEVSLFISSFIWLLYSFVDLHGSGIIGNGWYYCIPLLPIAALFAGPGATFTLCWYLREKALVSFKK